MQTSFLPSQAPASAASELWDDPRPDSVEEKQNLLDQLLRSVPSTKSCNTFWLLLSDIRWQVPSVALRVWGISCQLWSAELLFRCHLSLQNCGFWPSPIRWRVSHTGGGGDRRYWSPSSCNSCASFRLKNMEKPSREKKFKGLNDGFS